MIRGLALLLSMLLLLLLVACEFIDAQRGCMTTNGCQNQRPWWSVRPATAAMTQHAGTP